MLAAASGSELEELVILGRMDARLATPPLAIGGERPEQFLGVVDVPSDVVVSQDDHLATERGILPCDGLHWSPSDAVPIQHGKATELTPMHAAASGEEEPCRVIAAMEQVVP